jgi:hypothetical protein
MNLFKTACIAAILLANVVSTATADDVRWTNYSCSGGNPYQGGAMTDGDLDSSRNWKSAYTFYNEFRVVGGDKIVLTVWGFANEHQVAGRSSFPTTSFKFPARSFVIYRTFGGDQITGFKMQGFSQFTNYHIDWKREHSYYNGVEYDYGVGAFNCDIVNINMGMYMGCTMMKIYGDRPGMDYGMSWKAFGGLYVRVSGAVRNNFPRSLIR